MTTATPTATPSETTARTTARPSLDLEIAPPTADELGRAWEAVRAGRFRGETALEFDGSDSPHSASMGDRLSAATTTTLPGPVVTVVGAHGWSGASTTALLLAESAARAGWTVRLVDAADPVQSGLIGAAVTEHGHDQSGHWRRGTRGVAAGGRQPGQLRLERLDRLAAAPLAVPAAATSDPGDGRVDGAVDGAALTVVDAGWPFHELLRLVQDPVGRTHWLARLICSSPLVLSARATVPGVQRAAAAADQLQSVRTGGQTLTEPPVLVLALVGAHRLPRLLAGVVATTLPAISAQGRVVLVPSRRDFAVQGITSSDLPRQLTPAGARLLAMTGDAFGDTAPTGTPTRRHSTFTTTTTTTTTS